VTLARPGGIHSDPLSGLAGCSVTDPWAFDTEGVLNLGLLVPFAGLATLATRRARLVGAAAVVTSAAFEALQATLGKGVCDSSDLLRNATGALVAVALAGSR
jgi:hypothetical protein